MKIKEIFSFIVAVTSTSHLCIVIALDLSNVQTKATQNDLFATYLDLNDFLWDHVLEEDPESNFEVAKTFLEGNIRKGLTGNESLNRAVKLLTALASIKGENRCNRNSYAILKRNDLATDGRATLTPKKDHSLLRIDKIVLRYCLEHAKYCRNIYPVTLDNQLKKMNQQMIELVETFSGDIIDNSLSQSDDSNIARVLYEFLTEKKFASQVTDEIVYNTFISIASEELKLISDKSSKTKMFSSLFRKYLLDPCEYYVRQLGPDIFLPASFDASKYHEVDSERLEFYYAWARFQICAYVTGQQKPLLIKTLRLAEQSTGGFEEACNLHLFTST